MNLTKPSRIPKNATVGIFTPSEPLTDTRLEKVLQGADSLSKCGFSVMFSENYMAKSFYMAGEIKARVNDFHELMADENTDILMVSWGGKSCCQLLPYLNYNLICEKNKSICGFSDGGVLVNAIFAKSGLIAFYGPNVVGKLDETEYADMRSFLEDGLDAGSNILPQSKDSSTISPGIAEGTLIGGNLSTFVNGIAGTSFEPDVQEIILFWESGKKTSQEFDYLFTSLKLSPLFEKVKGIVIGDCEVKHDKKWGDRDLFEIIQNVFENSKFPILYAPVFGHKKLPNPVFPIGCRVRLNCGASELILLESPFS